MPESSPSTVAAHRNEVTLVGRLAAPGQVRTLPSGDTIVQFRLVVRRTSPAARRSRVCVDTLDCVAWTARLRRQVSGWSAGDELALTGALRRRFWRVGGAGPASRYEVEVRTVRRVGRATMTG